MTDPLADWLRVTEAQGSLLAVTQLPARWGVAIDASQNAAFHLMVRGTGQICVDDQVVALEEGDLVVLPRGEAHVVRSDAGAPVVTLGTPGLGSSAIPRPNALLCGHHAGARGAIADVWRGLPQVVHVQHAALNADDGLAHVVHLLRAEVLNGPRDGAGPLIASLLDALMVYALRAWGRTSSCGGSWLGALRDPGLSLALRAVHERPAEPWSVEDLAKVAGMSRAAFARRFRERLDEAPMAYVQRWRIALATRLLAEPGVSVAEVAARVGYTSEFAFNRAFKRQVGSAPGKYRRGRPGDRPSLRRGGPALRYRRHTPVGCPPASSRHAVFWGLSPVTKGRNRRPGTPRPPTGLRGGPLAPSDLQEVLGLKHRPTFRTSYLRPALEAGLIEATLPDKPTKVSPYPGRGALLAARGKEGKS